MVATVGAVVLTPLVALATFLVVVPPPVDGFDPQVWSPGPGTEFPTELTSTAVVETLQDTTVHGPEDTVTDTAGRVYTGDRDGTIWRFDGAGGAPERWAEVGGRPLGLGFAPDGRLLVANHGIGLQAVAPDGTVATLLDEVDGEPVLFANDLDVAADGRVYLSDSSRRYNTTTLGTGSSSYLLPDALDGRASGRVLTHDLGTGRSAVLLEDLHFPNGIALTEDGSTLWVAESNRYRVVAIDLGTGDRSTVLDDLPGTPDNIDRDGDGRMLVAVYDRTAVLDTFVLPHEIGRQVLVRLPTELFVNSEDPLAGSVVVAGADGSVERLVTGLRPAATSVHPAGDRWYLGALLGQPVRWMPAPR